MEIKLNIQHDIYIINSAMNKSLLFLNNFHNQLQMEDIPPNHILCFSNILSKKSPPSWGYESTWRRKFLRVSIVHFDNPIPNKNTIINSHSNLNHPALLPINMHNLRDEVSLTL